jgi:hypothetical protein
MAGTILVSEDPMLKKLRRDFAKVHASLSSFASGIAEVARISEQPIRGEIRIAHICAPENFSISYSADGGSFGDSRPYHAGSERRVLEEGFELLKAQLPEALKLKVTAHAPHLIDFALGTYEIIDALNIGERNLQRAERPRRDYVAYRWSKLLQS